MQLRRDASDIADSRVTRDVREPEQRLNGLKEEEHTQKLLGVVAVLLAGIYILFRVEWLEFNMFRFK